MEIKTTEKIQAEYYTAENFEPEKKWVAVDDLIEWVRAFSWVSGDGLSFREYICKDLIAELTENTRRGNNEMHKNSL